jgi:hypothetical protein
MSAIAMSCPTRLHTLTPAELAKARRLRWEEILLLAAARTARNQVEVNSVTAPILEKLK